MRNLIPHPTVNLEKYCKISPYKIRCARNNYDAHRMTIYLKTFSVDGPLRRWYMLRFESAKPPVARLLCDNRRPGQWIVLRHQQQTSVFWARHPACDKPHYHHIRMITYTDSEHISIVLTMSHATSRYCIPGDIFRATFYILVGFPWRACADSTSCRRRRGTKRRFVMACMRCTPR